MLDGQNIIVLDCETLHSANDCRHCGLPEADHYQHRDDTPWCPPDRSDGPYSPIGWGRKLELGLSVGCYYDYQDCLWHWFDVWTLQAMIAMVVERQPLLVSFNGIMFDFPLCRALLRDRGTREQLPELMTLCDQFKALCATSYDILAEVWRADPTRKFERGLNALDAISQANGLGAKPMDGATAPRLWAQGRYADVLNYCAGDVLKTKQLFEQIVQTGQIRRGDGQPITLVRPLLPA